ncbi:hypothetical protein CLUG_02316 [Clavispora lusitaniae ATCC 42720]|uniref:Uncharacterized protein n=1 Tax=Clavispora lusitaniae (strain ATCC 42720) TaxID=306902 RepID=C4Y3U4_CLAL4|nr:uncharacterized protein CLUG_02316 [Clavispora lusitaniae ATCC 42720]EEQ38190.1 hypothetical protein CLUG_02316 [Clavispora lusitaniae ATCC 42720]
MFFPLHRLLLFRYNLLGEAEATVESPSEEHFGTLLGQVIFQVLSLRVLPSSEYSCSIQSFFLSCLCALVVPGHNKLMDGPRTPGYLMLENELPSLCKPADKAIDRSDPQHPLIEHVYLSNEEPTLLEVFFPPRIHLHRFASTRWPLAHIWVKWFRALFLSPLPALSPPLEKEGRLPSKALVHLLFCYRAITLESSSIYVLIRVFSCTSRKTN